MRPIVVAKTGTGSSPWIPLDYVQSYFSVGLGLVISGTLSTDVEHTFDNIQDPAVTPIAFKHTVLVNKTANADSNYASPVRAIRITNNSGSGTATLTIIQGGA